jgi:diaminohydroxyphosphoribosylaminopyrimidine deaminase/5-amino-6-(5-phosphoribosylamino)uracil reductase
LLNGESKWITGLNTRKYIHLQRLRNDGILTGINTINNDDAKLDCRIEGLEEFSPTVLILDSNLKIDLKSKILKRKNISIITTSECNKSKRDILIENGVKIKILESDKNNIISIKSILDFLNELKINKLLIEAGSMVNTFFLKNKLIDKIILCRSGLVLGSDAQSFFNEINLQTIPKKAIYKLSSSFQIDDDVVEEWKINN